MKRQHSIDITKAHEATLDWVNQHGDTRNEKPKIVTLFNSPLDLLAAKGDGRTMQDEIEAGRTKVDVWTERLVVKYYSSAVSTFTGSRAMTEWQRWNNYIRNKDKKNNEQTEMDI